MPDPLTTAYTRQQIFQAAHAWLIDLYGRPGASRDQAEQDRWHQRYGLLIAFLSDQFPDFPPS